MYKIGIEREGLRCDKNGVLSKLPHPEIFGDRLENKLIGTDFGEAQIELRTPVCDSTKNCYLKLREITNVVLNELSDREELLWPYSMPCVLPKEEDFIFNNYDGYPEEKKYEEYLYKKYGYRMHNMSGIHINISFDDELISKLKEYYPNIPEKKDEIYLKICRTFINKAWIFGYFTGASPRKIDSDIVLENSYRTSKTYGFKNNDSVDYSSKENYVKKIQKLVDERKNISCK